MTGFAVETIEELALSEAHDAAGRHDDAINALARATQAGDIEATTRLGKRLVAGDRAPFLPSDGVRFLVDAANRGGAEAVGRLAVLTATGAHMKQSWNDAVAMLGASAERGWQPAREQLCVLSADEALASQHGENLPASHWTELSRAIDIVYWQSAAASETLSESPRVCSVADFIPARACRWLIEQSRDKLERARVYDAFLGSDTTNEVRTNSAALFNLMNTDLVHSLVQARMAATTGMPFENLEAPSVLHYETGQEIGEHYDFVDPRTPNYAAELQRLGQRVITFLVYLNAEYEGGDTEFPRIGVSYRGACGAGLYFVNSLPGGEPDLRTAHAGRPPSSGEKWILSQFIRDRSALHGAAVEP
jgi:prolyl 4-hydroxylase